ncbi:MAG: hypothetical protein RBT49_13565 [Bacteroidales bacterium]|jgi:hypothetical protein|nr:hypothetical protein [Bacteroidales bacterium]
MKTIKLLFIGLAVLSLGLFTSCEDDELATGPTIEFFGGEYIAANTQVSVDSTYTFKWTVTKGSADLDQFTIRVGNQDWIGYPKTDIDEDIYTAMQSFNSSGTGETTYTFIATDEDGLTATKNITITAVANSGPIDTYTDKILGSYDATEGSSFASVDGSVMTSSQALANSDAVDFVYWYGASALATLSAPSTNDALDIYPGIANWSTKNETLMALTTLTATEFDAIVNDAAIVTASSALGTVKKVNDLAVGDVVVFQTAATSENASKKGLLKVVAITGTGGTGTIEIEVKVQQ